MVNNNFVHTCFCMAVKRRMLSFRNLLITLLIVISVPVFCQKLPDGKAGKTIDSLKLTLKNLPSGAKQDTTRCNVLRQICNLLQDADFEKYNRERMQLIEKNLKENTPQNNFYLKNQAIAYSNIGVMAFDRGEAEVAMENFELSKKISEQILYKIGVIEAMLNIAQVHKLRGDLGKALELFNKCEILSRKIN